MAETLTELVAKITTDASGLSKGLSDAEGKTEQSSKRMADSLKKVGIAMAASGAAITAALGFMGKAAIDEEINIKNLAAALKGVGVNYDDVKDSLEGVIAATQRKTGIADDEQRDILNKLLLVTKDYNKALELLPLTLDLAAAGQMDAKTAAVYLSKAYEELEQGADKIGIRMGTTTVYFKDLAEVEQLVGGRAEELVNPFNVLKASMGDVAETIGANLVPIIKGLTDKIVDIAIKVQEWTKEHPELAKVITLVATGLGILLTVVGGLILILPGLIAGIAAFGVVFHAALGPVGLISIAITALIAIGTALYLNWDKVSKFFMDAWSNMKIAVLNAVDYILEKLESFVGWLPFFGDKITEAREKISNMVEAEKVEKDLRAVQASLEEVEVALADTIEIREQHTKGIEIDTVALEENAKALEEQKEAHEKLLNQIMKTRQQYEYERSEAGQLKISIKDLTFALFYLGKTNEEIGNTFTSLGDDADNVNKALEAFGLTALQVKGILDAQKESVDALGDAYVRANEKAVITPRAGGTTSVGGGTTYYGSAAERLSEEQNMSLGAAQSTIERYSTNPQSEEFAPVKGIMESIVGYKKGGFVNETGLAYLHAGETVIPANESMGGVQINFTQPVFFDREDTMNRFVDMIRKGIQRQDRLRFGGAYAG